MTARGGEAASASCPEGALAELCSSQNVGFTAEGILVDVSASGSSAFTAEGGVWGVTSPGHWAHRKGDGRGSEFQA